MAGAAGGAAEQPGHAQRIEAIPNNRDNRRDRLCCPGCFVNEHDNKHNLYNTGKVAALPSLSMLSMLSFLKHDNENNVYNKEKLFALFLLSCKI